MAPEDAITYFFIFLISFEQYPINYILRMRHCSWSGLVLLLFFFACQSAPDTNSVENDTDLEEYGIAPRKGVLPSSQKAYYLLDQTAPQSYENPIDVADSLRNHFQLAKALQIYNSILEHDPHNYPTLWRKSVTVSEMGFLLTNLSIKEDYYTEALHLAKRALGIEPNGIGAHFAMALALNRMESVVDDHRKITFAVKMKRHAETVLRKDSTYHYAWYLLGSWSYDFAGLSESDRSVAQSLFGTEEIDNATYDHATEYFLKALKYDPNNEVYNYHAAMAHLQVGHEEEALAFLRKAVQEEIDAEKEQEFIRNFNLMVTGHE